MALDAISNNSAATAKTQANNNQQTKEKEDVSLWESFCNEVIAPAIEDSARQYIDDNFGTDFVEQKKQEEEQKELEEALAKEKAKENQGIEEAAGELVANCAEDLINGYLDKNFGTELAKNKEEKIAKEEETLEKAKKMEAQKEEQEAKEAKETLGLITGIFKALFNKD